ncbi:MAG: hypothetical protein M3186_07140, partial [Actinomycetota bacterium]|nr:hypothetical protein [Actinomycetota bacterium]
LQEPPNWVLPAINHYQPCRGQGRLRLPQADQLAQGLNAMLLYEILARELMRDDQRRARQERSARNLIAARWWQRVARYADRRARRAAERR